MSQPAVAPEQPARVVMTFGRRVGIAAVVFLAARAISLTLYGVNTGLLVYRLAGPAGSLFQSALSVAIATVVVAGAVYTLVQAQRTIAANQPHWLASMPEQRLIVVLIALVVLNRIVPHVGWDSTLFTDPNQAPGYGFALVMRAVTTALAVAACCSWIWWCNSPPRVERLVAVSALAWVGFEFLMDLLDLVAPTVNVLVTRTYELGWTISLPGSDAYAVIHASSWIWRVGAGNIVASLTAWITGVAVAIPIAAVAAAILYQIYSRAFGPQPMR